ncbi:MAG: hypothetical protein MJ193_02960, partial [Clostridia bacterium]|nr:hypothetical protein [Clostridia bacterium]
PNKSCLPLKYKQGALDCAALESDDDFEAKEKYAVELVKEGVKQIQNGYIKPTIKSESSCEFCDFKDYCSYSKKFVRAEKKIGNFDFDIEKSKMQYEERMQGEYDAIPDEEK